MLFLLMSIVSSTLVTVCMRLSTGKSRNEMAFFGANYAVCTVLSLLFRAGQGGKTAGNALLFAVLLGLISGVMYLASFMLLRKNIRENGVVLAAVFMKLGVLVPTVLAVAVWHERMKTAGAAGFLIAVLAIIVVNGEQEEGGTGSGAGSSRLLLLVLLLAGGFTDSLSKVYEMYGLPEAKDIYLTGTFGTALLISAVLALRKREGIRGQDLLWGMLVGIPNYFSSRFLLLALENLPAVAVYPVFNIGTILLVTLAGTLLFGEKIGRRKGIGLLLILLSLVLLNL